MRKSKQGPGLFDLIENDNDLGSGSLRTPRTSVPLGKSGHHGKKESTVHRPVSASGRSAGVQHGARGEAAPSVSIDGERIRFSLTSLTAAVAVFGLLVLLLVAFEFGRRLGDKTGFRRGHAAGRVSYSADAMSEIEAARRQPPAPGLVETLRPGSAGGAVPSGTVSGETAEVSGGSIWVRDYTYVVVQEFSIGREEDARRAQAFLAENDLGTEIVKYPSGAMQLITTQGYNRKDPTQRRLADQLQERVHALGVQYFAAGGGYRLEGYFKSLKGDTW